MTVQQLIDSLLRELDASSVYLDSPVVVKLGDRTYEAGLCGHGGRDSVAQDSLCRGSPPLSSRAAAGRRGTSHVEGRHSGKIV